MWEDIFDFVWKFAAPPAVRHINYLLNYASNLEKLQSELTKLGTENERIRGLVNTAKSDRQKIRKPVQKWLERVSDIIEDDPVEEFTRNEEIAAMRRCFIGLCPALLMRYQLSKEAVKLQDCLVELLKEAESFGTTISDPANPKVPPPPIEDYVPLQSRNSTLTKILSAFRDPDLNMIGIYGMGGIGKTTLAKEVGKQGKEEKLFHEAVFVEVSQHPNEKEIREKIAHSLGMKKFSAERDTEKLREKLKDVPTILIILDNIWARLDLKAIGIPVGDDHEGCKILLTARSNDVLTRKMGSKRNFPVDVLDGEEPWILFKKMAGDYIEGVEFKSTATDVVKECAGLPISIVTVGRALIASTSSNTSDLESRLKDASRRLRKPTSSDKLHEKAYSAVELSYDLLESLELEKFLLLIGYAGITSVDDLLMYWVGLGWFKDMKMEDARHRVRTLVCELKDSCMLLDDKANVKDFIMHDVVRDVAISIASEDPCIFRPTNQQDNQWKWPNKYTVKNFKSIVLTDAGIHQLQEVLECPKLKFLSIRARDSSLKFSDNFFKVVTKLSVLDMAKMDFSSPPPSLDLLKDLRTLRLHRCKVDNMAVIGALEKLEILSIRDSDIKQLPVEVGQLTRLRWLELTDCFRLEVIPPDVIRRLSNLEELYVGSFDEWEMEGNNNASLDELKHLSKLTALQICIKDAKTLPRDLFFERLERYKIWISRKSFLYPKEIFEYKETEDRDTEDGETEDGETEDEETEDGETLPGISRQFKLELSNTNISLKDGRIMQLRRIEDLRVSGSQDMKNVLYGLDRQGFPELRYLQVTFNPNLLCLVDSMENVTRNALAFPLLESLYLGDLPNMKKISRGQLAAGSFCKLRNIIVENCSKLKNLFSLSIAGRLLQLQSIQVSGCGKMGQIFATGSEDEFNNNDNGAINIIEFGQLHSLILCFLPQLTSFCSRSETAGTASNAMTLADDIDVLNTLFHEKVALPKLAELELNGIQVERIWKNQAVAMSCGIQNLTHLIIISCSNLRCLFSSSIATSFVQLQQLLICQCPALEEMVVDDDRLREEGRKIVVFPQLVYLTMEDLQNLTKFCSSDYVEFPSLKKLEIKDCPELKGFMVKNNIETDLTEIPLFNEKVAFPSLESLLIRNCGSLEAIFGLDGPNVDGQLSAVTQSSELQIGGLPKLRNLRMVMIYGCDRLKNVFPASIAGSLLQLESLHIRRCGVEEIVFASEGGAETNTRLAFPRVTSLQLHDLPELTTFFPQARSLEWPALKSLEVSGWEIVKIFNGQPQDKVFPNLEELIVEGKAIETTRQFSEVLLRKLKFLHVLFNKSAVFSSLDFLQRFHSIKMLKISGQIPVIFNEEASAWITSLNECSDVKHLLEAETNMDHLVHLDVAFCRYLVNLVPSSTSFQTLTTLALTNCDNLRNTVTSSTAKSLVQLKQMSLFECNMITEVVADDGDGGNDEIVFRKLKILYLTCLKSLTSFCSGSCTLSFPSLDEVTVYKCPEMNIFSGGVLSAPNLQKVKKHWGDEVGYWKGDLNTTIQQLHEETGEPETSAYDMEEIAEGRTTVEKGESSKQGPTNLLCGIWNKDCFSG